MLQHGSELLFVSEKWLCVLRSTVEECYVYLLENSGRWSVLVSCVDIVYRSGLQPGVRVPPRVHEDILGACRIEKKNVYCFVMSTE
jgi:hypothetical protein